MTEGSITNKIQEVLDDFSNLKYRIEKQTSYLETLQFEEEKYRPRENRPHETWNFNEENFACYEEDETHRYPHLFHTENPQLNNIACMLAYIIKNCCYKKFHQRMDEIQESILKLLENKERYLTLDELSQFLTPEIIKIQEKVSERKETSESKQLTIRPPSNFF
jgi:hypothetical protein